MNMYTKIVKIFQYNKESLYPVIVFYTITSLEKLCFISNEFYTFAKKSMKIILLGAGVVSIVLQNIVILWNFTILISNVLRFYNT